MKKLSKKVKIALVSIVLMGAILFSGITYIVGDMVYQETVGYVNDRFQNTSLEQVYADSPEVIQAIEKYGVTDYKIPSSNGYDVEAKYIKTNKESKNTVVIVHGIGMNMWRHFKEALMYLENDYNVMIYNQRYTGQTGGDNRSFGYYERNDIAAVMSFLREIYPDHTIGAHGFSMGAATLGMYSGMEEATRDADYLILDCPYDTMKGAIRVGIEKEDVPLIPIGYAVWAGDLYNQFKSGFKYEEVRPIDQVAKSKVPMFIIHGEADSTCTVDMGQALFDAKKEGYKEIWIEPETEHVRIFDDHPDKYEQKVMAFIEAATLK